jgi:hypothetical protein
MKILKDWDKNRDLNVKLLRRIMYHSEAVIETYKTELICKNLSAKQLARMIHSRINDDDFNNDVDLLDEAKLLENSSV